MNTLTPLPVVASEASIVAAEPLEPHADAELIALGEQLKLASERTKVFYAKADRLRRRPEYEAAIDALHYRESSVVDRTLAEQLGWNCGGQDLTGRVFSPRDIETLEAIGPDHPSSEAASRFSELVAAVRTIVLCGSSPELVGADEAAERANEATWTIVKQIEGLRAYTLVGIKVKADAIRFCRSGEPSDDEDVGSGATDARLAQGLLMDLAAL